MPKQKTKQYFCYGEYGATGEGIHCWISIQYADSKEQAWKKHKDCLGVDEYFKRGTYIIEANGKNKTKIKNLLENSFSEKMVNSLLADSPYGGYLWYGGRGDFFFQFDLNFS